MYLEISKRELVKSLRTKHSCMPHITSEWASVIEAISVEIDATSMAC